MLFNHNVTLFVSQENINMGGNDCKNTVKGILHLLKKNRIQKHSHRLFTKQQLRLPTNDGSKHKLPFKYDEILLHYIDIIIPLSTPQFTVFTQTLNTTTNYQDIGIQILLLLLAL